MVLRPARWRIAAIAVVDFVVAGYFGYAWLTEGKGWTPILPVVVFVGAGLIQIRLCFRREPSLTLGRDGFSVSYARGHANTVPWSDVSEFRTVRVGVFQKRVGFDFVPESSRKTRLAALNQQLYTADSYLTDNFGMTPTALTELLNHRLLQSRYATFE